jgi:hypothetical protein
MLSKQMAYAKWLGIKDQHQPPTLYRLLGVDAFESDADIISNSADSRMAYLRQFQIGGNAQIAADILNELSQARVVLLNADKKSAYDARLRQRLAAQSGGPASTNASPAAKVSVLPRAESGAQPAPVAANSPVLDLDSFTAEDRPTHSASPGRRKKKTRSLAWIAAAACVLLILGTLVVLNALSGRGEPSPTNTPQPLAIRSETPAAPAIASEVSATPQPTKKPVGNAAKDVPHRVGPQSIAPIGPPAAIVARQEPPRPDSETPIPLPPPEAAKSSDAVVPAATEPAALTPVPDASAQAEAIKLVKEVYGKEWAAAKTADQKRALAKKLLEKAMESQKDHLAEFVLLRLSKEMAEQASDGQTAFEAIEETDRVFQIDALEMKAEAIRKCAPAATTSDQHMSLAEKAAEVSDQTFAKDDFTIAKPMIDLALGEAKKAKDETLIKRFAERKAEVERNAQAFESVKKAKAILEKTPLNAEANLLAGKYECFFKGDWKSGLPKLALGNDPTLKTLAETDLHGASAAEEQTKLGDSWWTAAETQKGLEKKQAQSRAGYWYQQALPLLTGLQRDKIEKRLKESTVAEAAASLAPNPQDKWVVLFRSSDPAVWNTDSRETERYAIPLADAPARIRFLKMQMNAKEYVVIAMTKDKLGSIDTRATIGSQGTNTFVWGGHELGVFDPTKNAHAEGACAMAWQDGSEFSGWGFGYSNRQGYCWDRKPIGRTSFEISVTPFNLTSREKQHLLR